MEVGLGQICSAWRQVAFAVAALGLGACARSPRESSSAPAASVVGMAGEIPATTSSSPALQAAPASPPAPACGDSGDVLLFVSPERPIRGELMRVLAISDHPIDAQLTVGPRSGSAATTRDRQGGPPYFWLAQVDAPKGGKWRATLTRDAACGGGTVSSKDLFVGSDPLAPPPAPRTALWFTRAAWTPSLENLYSAWIEHLFDAPIDAQPSWGALHEVLRDRSRNVLFDYLGAEEDEQNIAVRPDCADLPYFLRAYFAYKLGLPFGWSHCSRGENGTPPTCSDFATQHEPFPPRESDAGAPPLLPAWANPDRDRSGSWEINAKRVGEFFPDHAGRCGAVGSRAHARGR